MLFNRDIPKSADIFIKSKKASAHRAYYKPLKKVKTVGLLLAAICVLLGLTIIILPPKQVNSSQAMISCPFIKNSNRGWNCGNWRHNKNTNDPDNDGDNDTTAQATPYPSVLIQSQVQPFALVSTAPA